MLDYAIDGNKEITTYVYTPFTIVIELCNLAKNKMRLELEKKEPRKQDCLQLFCQTTMFS